MNELQLVLLIFALLVVLVMLLMSQRSKKQTKPKTAAKPESKVSRSDANAALNELGEGHIPVSTKTQSRIHIHEDHEAGDIVPENQGKLAFGDEFEAPKPEIKQESQDPFESLPIIDVQERKPQHFVLEVEDLKTLDEVGPVGAAADKQPTFGRPANSRVTETENKLAEKTEPQVFAILVMGSQDFGMDALNKSLLGVGLSYSESMGIYVKKDTLGKPYLHVANVMEPGVFPSSDSEAFAQFTSPGVALILELPTSVKAPAAMNDMIMIARKVSQRLNGRLYDAQRHLLRESDIQAMRDAAIAYETVAI